MTPDEIAEALAQHKIWLDDSATGKRAYLAGANLADANLADANLVGATITLTDAIIRLFCEMSQKEETE